MLDSSLDFCEETAGEVNDMLRNKEERKESEHGGYDGGCE